MSEYNYFYVETYPVYLWQKKSLVHIVVDDTERTRKENLMQEFAYKDSLTGLYNHRYAMRKMQKWTEEKLPFVMSYIDMDYLKYCNDVHGHKTGDIYLQDTARALEAVGGILCRMGGDEFLIIQTEVTEEEQNKKLEKVRRVMHKTGRKKKYPMSFSYASCQVPVSPEMSLEEYMALADERMYYYKTRFKKPLKDLLYVDDRTDDEESGGGAARKKTLT